MSNHQENKQKCTYKAMSRSQPLVSQIKRVEAHGVLTDAGGPIAAELISILALAAEGPRLVVADSVGAADQRALSALVNV